MKVLAYSYRRFSSARQGSGASLERQLDSAREWAARHEVELDESLIDRGLSGYTGANRRKGELGRFLAQVQAGRIPKGSYLLLDDMSRLSRLPQIEAAGQLLDIVRAGIRVVTLNDGAVVDQDTDMAGMIMVVVKIQGAHDYSRELARKVGDGHRRRKIEAREKGRIYSKTGPSWLKLNADRSGWHPVPERVAVVKRIVEMALDQGMGTGAIASRLNKDGVANFRSGADWHGTTVNKILRSPALRGHYQPRFRDGKPDGGLALGYFGEGLVNEPTWYRLQSRLDQSRTKKGKRPLIDEVRNLCYGLTRCGECGHNMVVQRRTKDGVHVYYCYGMQLGKCENRRRWKVRVVEDALLRGARDLDLDSAQRESEARRALDVAEGQRAEVIARMRRALRFGNPDNAIVREEFDTLEAELKRLDSVAADLRRVLEREGLGANPADHQQKVAALSDQLASAEGQELYDLRSRLAVAIRELIGEVVFFPADHIRFGWRNGVNAYMVSGLSAMAHGVRYPSGIKSQALPDWGQPI